MSAKPVYAPLPVRALADQELDRADFRVLGIIAAHDRLNANGSGCYANHKRLAAKIGIHFVTFSKSVTKLARLGYLTGEVHPLNRRLRVYRVIYTDADRELMASSPDGIVSAKANDSPQPLDWMVSAQANEPPTIVSLGNRQAPENVEQSSVNIFCEAENTSSRSYEIHSSEEASLGSAAWASEYVAGNEGAFLAIVERRLKAGEFGFDDLEPLASRLEEIASLEDFGDGSRHRAERLLDEVSMVLESHP